MRASLLRLPAQLLQPAGSRTAGSHPGAAPAFFYVPHILVFVDGSPHYRDYVQAADERKRRRLKALSYRIVVVKADDPEAGLSDLRARVGS